VGDGFVEGRKKLFTICNLLFVPYVCRIPYKSDVFTAFISTNG
jgi:spore maturation protein SpmB